MVVWNGEKEHPLPVIISIWMKQSDVMEEPVNIVLSVTIGGGYMIMS